MPGQPRLREAAWLYGTDPDIPLAHVRLEERADGTGWDLYLSDPARAPSQHVRYDTEDAARAELERIYREGQADGEWRITKRPS
ncbi:hypothetical protein [Micromonospora sp. NPDC051006]|uniref:hypothetical protein n=1 Tax=Micromonospora sp. NPDC051006 TaxID=3364283 RepID=UPI003789A6BA